MVASSGIRGSVVGYNVQVAVDTEHHLIVTHEVTNTGSDRSQLAKIASQAKEVLGADELDVVADRGSVPRRYFWYLQSPHETSQPPCVTISGLLRRCKRCDDSCAKLAQNLGAGHRL
jgi:hypothetical protein